MFNVTDYTMSTDEPRKVDLLARRGAEAIQKGFAIMVSAGNLPGSLRVIATITIVAELLGDETYDTTTGIITRLNVIRDMMRRNGQ